MAELKHSTEFVKGLWKENPVLRLLLGLCPTLAVTTSVENGIAMGLAATFVLVMSNLVTAVFRSLIPARMRIPCFIVIIAGFVTIVDLVLQAYFFSLSQSLGVFIPLIVVNCVILQRAEAFAYKNGVLISITDAFGMGVGFTLTLAVLGAIRELFGNGTILNIAMTPESFHPAIIMILPPGAFISLGLLIAGMNWVTQRQTEALKAKARVERAAARREA